MTTDKARKHAVRTRMSKTGERYAAARRNVVADDVPTGLLALPPRIADPGMTNAAIEKGTGSGWDEWFRSLDAWGAADRTHTDIARYVRDEREVDGWWAQAVTVGYERARGLRAVHQTSRGFEVSVSKMVGAPPALVWEAFLDPTRRASWLEAEVLGERRRAGAVGRSATFNVPADGSRVTVAIDPRDEGRATVTVTHLALADATEVEQSRAAWRKRLGRLGGLFAKDA